MGEPLSSTVSVALGAGLGAVALTALGIHPQPLFWALIGATLGLSLAPKAERLRALAVFVCVVLSSALLGTWAARTYWEGSLLAADGAAWALAVAFHPLLIAFLNAVPALLTSVLGGWIKRFAPGGGAEPAPPPPPTPPATGAGNTPAGGDTP